MKLLASVLLIFISFLPAAHAQESILGNWTNIDRDPDNRWQMTNTISIEENKLGSTLTWTTNCEDASGSNMGSVEFVVQIENSKIVVVRTSLSQPSYKEIATSGSTVCGVGLNPGSYPFETNSNILRISLGQARESLVFSRDKKQ